MLSIQLQFQALLILNLILSIECYYTIDAGPNVKVLCQLRNIKNIVKAFETSFNNVNIVVASFGSGISYLDR